MSNAIINIQLPDMINQRVDHMKLKHSDIVGLFESFLPMCNSAGNSASHLT